MKPAGIPVPLEAPQVGQEVGGVLIAEAAFLFEAPFHKLFEFERDPAAHRCQWRRGIRQDAVDEGLIVFSLERQDPGRDLMKHNTQRPDVGEEIDRSPAQLLRRHVCGCADRCSFTGDDSGPGRLGQSEIRDLDLPLLRYHDV